MANLHRRYEPATGPSGGATPGARALMSWYLGAYSGRGAANLGIYNPKRLGSGWSLHAEGRACDLGTAPYGNPSGAGSWPAWGQALANALVANSKALGVQAVIFRRRIWSGAQPDAGWRTYSGSNPHDGHLHVELSRDAAQTLTVERIEQTIGGGSKPAPPPPPAANWREELIRSLPTIRRGDRGPAVSRAQGLCVAFGGQARREIERSGGVDGIFGAGTERAVRIVQQSARPVDGIVGPITWRALLPSLPTIRRGDRGPAVSRAQGLCVAFGGDARREIERSGGVDGILGAGTDRAVRVVQRQARPIDGIVGRITWTKLVKG